MISRDHKWVMGILVRWLPELKCFALCRSFSKIAGNSPDNAAILTYKKFCPKSHWVTTFFKFQLNFTKMRTSNSTFNGSFLDNIYTPWNPFNICVNFFQTYSQNVENIEFSEYCLQVNMKNQDAKSSISHDLFTFTKWSLLRVPDIHFYKNIVRSGCCNSACGLCYICNPVNTLPHASRGHTRSDICLPQSRARSDSYHPRDHSYLHFRNHTVGYNLRSKLLHILNIWLIKRAPTENSVNKN